MKLTVRLNRQERGIKVSFDGGTNLQHVGALSMALQYYGCKDQWLATDVENGIEIVFNENSIETVHVANGINELEYHAALQSSMMAALNGSVSKIALSR